MGEIKITKEKKIKEEVRFDIPELFYFVKGCRKNGVFRKERKFIDDFTKAVKLSMVYKSNKYFKQKQTI